ncbi:MAG TPA: PilZ domain-containing protein [Planctomycetaceae bacterium]
MPPADRRSLDRRSFDRRAGERRRPRLAVPGLPVRLLRGADGGKTVLTGRLLDISPTGVRLQIDGEVQVDEVLLIEARLAAGCLNLAARVAWAKLEGEGIAVGCRLSAPPAGEKLAELRRLAKAPV